MSTLRVQTNLKIAPQPFNIIRYDMAENNVDYSKFIISPLGIVSLAAPYHFVTYPASPITTVNIEPCSD